MNLSIEVGQKAKSLVKGLQGFSLDLENLEKLQWGKFLEFCDSDPIKKTWVGQYRIGDDVDNCAKKKTIGRLPINIISLFTRRT